MNHAEINELLSKVSITVSAIEEELLIPAGVLSKAKNGKRDLPAKYEQRLRDFVSGDLDVSSGVVFSGRVIDSECMELLRSDEGIETPGDAVSFLCKFWMENRSVGGEVEMLVLNGGLNVRPTPANIELYFGVSKNLPSASIDAVDRQVLGVLGKKIEPSAVVDVVSGGVKPSIDDLRKLMDAPMKGIFDLEEEVVVEKVDYQKLYDECMFPDEYKALWERISSDPNVSAKELPIWKIRLNVK